MSAAHDHRHPRFYWRAFTTLLVVLGFFVLALTGVGLYVTPPGRIANWAGWTLVGLTKAQWQAVHMVFGLLFVVAGGFHLFFNWRVLLSYLRRHLTEGLRRKREIAWSLVSTAALIVLSIGDVPPVSAVAALRETISNSWSDPTTEPPTPHAELLTLAQLTESRKLRLEPTLATLREAGATATPETTLADVAGQLEVTPQDIYRKLGVARPATSPAGGGMGWKTLRLASGELEVPLETALARLAAKGISAEPDATLRDIASRNDLHAPELVTVIKGESK